MRPAIRPAITTLALLVLAAGSLAAQEAPASSQLRVTRAVVATGVEDREPVGEAESFPASVGTLYFYTVFEGDFAETTLEHVWLREGEEVARVPAPCPGPALEDVEHQAGPHRLDRQLDRPGRRCR